MLIFDYSFLMKNQQKYLSEAQKIILHFQSANEYAIFLFGSRARGTEKENSDIDIGVWGNKPFDILLKAEIEEELEESRIPLRINLVDFYFSDMKFKKEATKNMIKWNWPKNLNLT